MKKRGRGRPFLPKGVAKTAKLVLRLQPSELKLWKKLAKHNTSLSEWVRMACQQAVDRHLDV